MLSKPMRQDCGCGGGKYNCITKNTFAKILQAELKRLDCGCGCKGVKGFKKKYGLVGKGILNDCPPGYRNDGLTCLEECKSGEVDDGLFCRDTNPPGPGWVNDGLTFRNTNPPGPDWVNDGLTFRNAKCPDGWINDGLTCRALIQSYKDPCPAGSRDDGTSCWGKVSEVCADDCSKGWDGCKHKVFNALKCNRWKAPCRDFFGTDWCAGICEEYGGWDCIGGCPTSCAPVDGIIKTLADRNYRTWGGEVVPQEVRGQEIRSHPTRGKDIKGRVNFEELLKEVDKGLAELFSEDGALARAFDPEKNGISDAFRKFGDDMKRVLEEVGNRIKDGFDKMGAAAKAAFEEFARNAERDFKQFGDDFVAKMKNPDFWVEAIGIMAMIAGAALSLALTVGTLGLGAPAAAGIMAAFSMAGPAAKMIASAAKGEPIDALDIAQIVIAGATAAIPGMGPTVQTFMKVGTTAASFAISAVQVGQGLGLIPSTCVANCPPPEPDPPIPEPPLDPPPPPSKDPPPPGQLTDDQIMDLAPPCTFLRIVGKPNNPPPCNTLPRETRNGPPYYTEEEWIADYRAKNYGTNPTGPAGALTSPEDKAAADAITVPKPTGPEINLGQTEEEEELDLDMSDFNLDDELDEQLDLDLDELEDFPTVDEDEIPKLDLDIGELDLDLESAEDEELELQPVKELDLETQEKLDLDVEAAEDEELDLDLEVPDLKVEKVEEIRQQPINRPVFDAKAYEVPPPSLVKQKEAPNVEIPRKRMEDFALVKNIAKKIKKRLTSNSRRMTGGANSKSLTLYYADWCHFCTKLMPIWKKLNVPNIEIRMVEEKQNNELEVDGYPTIIYRNGNQIEKYIGPRTKSGLEKFLKNKL